MDANTTVQAAILRGGENQGFITRLLPPFRVQFANGCPTKILYLRGRINTEHEVIRSGYNTPKNITPQRKRLDIGSTSHSRAHIKYRSIVGAWRALLRKEYTQKTPVY
ncbi:hypothetical protein Pmani_026372 [Petrolisthes manimaculis]|uniref:Uncharacterized protein n=1 Tax=Petrolisthes manimaculis TaxID=1843537 RepID=A0AAE1U092_9EUCA|nr:hypothetical protein Pmani_026372 [Petrolisthes manimaculis]